MWINWSKLNPKCKTLQIELKKALILNSSNIMYEGLMKALILKCMTRWDIKVIPILSWKKRDMNFVDEYLV